MLLGEYLLTHGAVSEEELKIGQQEAKASGSLLGVALVRLGFIRQQYLERVLKEIDPDSLIDTEANQEGISLPPEFVTATRTIFCGDLGAEIAIATLHDDPGFVVDEVRRITGREVRLVGAAQTDFDRIFSDASNRDEQQSLAAIEDVNLIIARLIKEALHLGASDIHLEPQEYYNQHDPKTASAQEVLTQALAGGGLEAVSARMGPMREISIPESEDAAALHQAAGQSLGRVMEALVDRGDAWMVVQPLEKIGDAISASAIVIPKTEPAQYLHNELRANAIELNAMPWAWWADRDTSGWRRP